MSTKKMFTKGKQKSGSDQSQTKEKADVFVWTGDEVQLLLKVTGEYKTKKASENVDLRVHSD